jgi:polyphosphate glucokinase
MRKSPPEKPAMENARPPSAPTRADRIEKKRQRTLAVDIGGTGIKAELLDEQGRPLTDRARIPTPKHATPREVVAIIRTLAKKLRNFERVSVGFPGVTKNGVIYTAPNLGKGWNDFPLERKLKRALDRPVRVANDADVQGLAVIAGKGVEMVITLGTGFGTGLYLDGRLGPHLELSHHPFRKGETYDEHLGNAARKKVGNKKWNKRVRKAIDELRSLTSFDHLYIGGGNAKKIDFELDPDVTLVSNEAGIRGGVALWQD